MKRKITQRLKVWKAKENDKPLMLLGARQVGKTYALDYFCKSEYPTYIYINLDQEVEIKSLFEQSLSVDEIIDAICVLKNVQITPNQTVIFMDEIQVSEKAIHSLKYFAEADKNYDMVVAGSILGVALNRQEISFPVGKVYRMHLYPLDFEEYLWAFGEMQLADVIKKHFHTNRQMLDPIHKKALKLYRNYLYIGGMPASVVNYVRANSALSEYDDHILNSLIDDYLADMSKYTTKIEAIKIAKVYRSLPRQLGQSNTKFTYKLIEDHADKRGFETSIEWLIHSYIVEKIALCELPKLPLSAYEKNTIFKLYAHDVGILTHLANLTKADMVSSDSSMFMGMLTENYVANALTACGFNLYFWKSKNMAEIDFVTSINGDVVPIEVKAAANTKSKSLKSYMNQYAPKYAIRISSKNFGMVNQIKSVPLYAVFCLGDNSMVTGREGFNME